MTSFPPLEHRLVDHLSGSPIRQDTLEVFVGTRPVDDGWVAAVLRIDRFSRKQDADWLGIRAHADLLTHLSFVNQETVPIEAVEMEVARPECSRLYSCAAFVALANMTEAEAFVSFLTEYANPA